jgi:acetyl esterase/lipase
MNPADAKDCFTWCATELPKKLAAAGNNNGSLLDTTRIAVSGSSAGGYLALLIGLYATGPVRPKIIMPIYPITDPLGTFFTTSQAHPAGHIDTAALEPYLDPKAPVQTRTASEGDPRAKFYFYMMQEAILAKLLGIKDGDDTFSVASQIRKRGGYLPTFIVHGDADRFVGVEQSDEVVEALRDIGAVVEYERPPGLDHIFDQKPDVKLNGYYTFFTNHV